MTNQHFNQICVHPGNTVPILFSHESNFLCRFKMTTILIIITDDFIDTSQKKNMFIRRKKFKFPILAWNVVKIRNNNSCPHWPIYFSSIFRDFKFFYEKSCDSELMTYMNTYQFCFNHILYRFIYFSMETFQENFSISTLKMNSSKCN